MISVADPVLRSRVLILAPVGRDAALTCAVLDRAGFSTLVCSDLDQLQQRLAEGAGAAVITEEALAGRDVRSLADWIGRQPSWSDFPFIMLLKPGGSPEPGTLERDLLQDAGNLTLLERPVGTATLVSAVRAALRARGRQYEVHDALEALTASERRVPHIGRSAAAASMDQSAGRLARLFQPPMGGIHGYPRGRAIRA